MNKIISATYEDVKEITQLLADYDISVSGSIETIEEDTEAILKAADDLEKFTWIVKEDEKIIAFAVVTKSNDLYPSLVIVHPDYQNRGIETELINQMERSIDKGTLTVSSNTSYEHQIFEEKGFFAKRYWYSMKIELQGVFLESTISAPFQMKKFQTDQDLEMTHLLFEESFKEHFGYEPSSLEDFKKRTERPGFDPNLWFLLMDGDKAVGFIFCSRGAEDQAEITHLGVSPNFRKLGLGKVLLNYAFRVLSNEGRTKVFLNVDSENGTGAVKVYEAVGMNIERQFIRYDKTIVEQIKTI